VLATPRKVAADGALDVFRVLVQMKKDARCGADCLVKQKMRATAR
jgi:hypothetical protein